MLSNIQNLRQIGDLPKCKVTPEAEVPAVFLLYINIIYAIHVYSYHLYYKFCKYLYNKKIQLSDVTQCHVPMQKKLHYQRISTKQFWKRKNNTSEPQLLLLLLPYLRTAYSNPVLSTIQVCRATDSFLFLVYVLCVPTQQQLD